MYKEKLTYMLSIFNKTNNTNIVKDFFAQLAHADDLEVFPIINAISSTTNDVNKLIFDSVQIKPWMYKIGLEDIRNIIIFILWRDYKIVCSMDEDYVPNERIVQKLIRPSNGFTNNLIKLLEICFYVEQIYYIKQNIMPEKPNRFIPWVHSYYTKFGLKKIVYALSLSILPLQKLF